LHESWRQHDRERTGNVLQHGTGNNEKAEWLFSRAQRRKEMSEKVRLVEVYRDMYGAEFQPTGGIGDRALSGGRTSDALEYMATQLGRLNKNIERIIQLMEQAKN
jgi:hypothetical protein